jgi:sugar-specific transcriptional regulator TrmB
MQCNDVFLSLHLLMQDLTTLLEQFGFSEKEAKVYLACLELGQAPASTIARQIGEERTATYHCLQSLVKKNAILTINKNKVVRFSAVSPEHLVKATQSKLDMLHEHLPVLLSLYNKFNEKPNLISYEGLEGLKMIYEDILSYHNATIRFFIGRSDVMQTSLKRLINNFFLPMRKKRNIFAQVIVSSSEQGKQMFEILSNPTQQLAEVKFVVDSDFALKDGIYLYGEKKVAISMFSEHEMMGLIINSETLYTTLSALFDFIRNHTETKNVSNKVEK